MAWCEVDLCDLITIHFNDRQSCACLDRFSPTPNSKSISTEDSLVPSSKHIPTSSAVDSERERETERSWYNLAQPDFRLILTAVMLRTPLLRSRTRLCAPIYSPAQSQWLLNRPVQVCSNVQFVSMALSIHFVLLVACRVLHVACPFLQFTSLRD